MPPKIIDPNVEFRKANSRYKIWFSFKNKTSITLYGTETVNTYSQMLYGKVTSIVLDRLLGFENCKKMAEVNFFNKYNTAIIYDAITDTPVRKYVGDTVEDLQTVNLTDAERYRHFTVQVTNNQVALLPTNNTPNFKKLVTDALNNR